MGLVLFWVFCTDRSRDKRVSFLWVFDNPPSKLWQLFHFEVGFNGFFFFFFLRVCWKARYSSCHLSPSRNMKANVWKNCWLKDEPCPPWKCVGVPSAMCQCIEAGLALGPRCYACDAGLLHVPVEISTCLSPPLSSLTVVLTNQWIKCVLYSCKKIIFNWGIFTWQWCVGFCGPITWFSPKYTYVPFIWSLPPF